MTLTVGEFFDELPGRFKSDQATGMTSIIQWHITDAEPGVWAFEINDGAGQVIPGGVPDPDTTFTTTTETWIAVAEGRQDAMRAFMTGKMKVEGDMTLALKVPELFETGISSPTATGTPED